jgi:hypothetical protein
MAFSAGVIRDRTGSYDPAFYLACGLCVVAALLSVGIRRRAAATEVASAHLGDELPALS